MAASQLAITHRFKKLLHKFNKFLSEALKIGDPILITSIEKRIKFLKKKLRHQYKQNQYNYYV